MECVLLLVLLFGCAYPAVCFHSVQWSAVVSPSQHCGVNSSSDLFNAITTVAQLIKSTASSSSLPKSCMEIKESSPVSPSGHYTISNGTSGGAAVVYCNMDDLYSCPSLEQILKGIRNDLYSCPALEQALNGIRDDYEQLSSAMKKDSEMLSQTLNVDHSKIMDQNDKLLDFHQYMPSCKAIKDKWPLSTTGWYNISISPGELFEIYCYMEGYCGSAGWKRVAELDMDDPTQNCPSQLSLYNYNGKRACGRYSSSSGGCSSSIFFSSAGYPFSQICGRVHGYQFGATDAIYNSSVDIDSWYIDGVSLTIGDPREHVWSFMSGLQENYAVNGGIWSCPCSPGSVQTVPNWIGSDYFCESGNPNISLSFGSIGYVTDPLWNGEECGSVETACCAAPDLPWFHKFLNVSTTDMIELRVCADEGSYNEIPTVFYYEIYVQ